MTMKPRLRVRGMNVRHVRAGLLQQRRHLEIGRDVFLAGRRVHDDERVGLRRPGGRIDVAARHAEIAAEAGVSGCHADSADAPSQVACQPGPDEGESRVVLEHSYKYSAQIVRETSIKAATCGLGLALLLTSRLAHADEPACPRPPQRPRATAPPAGRPSRRTRRRADHHREPTTTTSSSTSTATPCCRGNVVMRQGDAGHPRRPPRIRREERSAPSSTGGVEFSDPDAQGARQQRRVFAGARARNSRAREFELPERNARGAARNLQVDAERQGHAGRTCPSPPARSTDVAWQTEGAAASSSTRARATAPGAAPASSSRACRIIYLPWMTFPDRPAAQERLPVPEHRRLVAQRRGDSRCLTTGTSGRTSTSRPSRSTTPSAAWTSPASCATSRGASAARSTSTICPSDDIADRRPHARARSTHVAELPGDWRFRIDATDVSDSDYFEDFAHGPGRHQRAVRRTARGSHLSRRALERARAGPGFPDHRRRTAGRGPALRAHAAPARLGRLGLGPRRHRLRLRRRVRELRAQPRRHRLAHGRGAARRLRLVGAGILRAPLGGLSLHAVLARGPGAGHRRLADALAAVRVARCRPGVRTHRRLAGPAPHDARAARALSVHAVSRSERAAAVRHRAARPEPRAAVSHQPLRRRGPRQRRQPDRVRPHQPPVRLRQRRAVPRGERRPGLLLREAARGAAGRAAGDARHLRLHRAGFADGVQELERRSRAAMESRRHAQRALAVPPAIPARRRSRR